MPRQQSVVDEMNAEREYHDYPKMHPRYLGVGT